MVTAAGLSSSPPQIPSDGALGLEVGNNRGFFPQLAPDA